MNTTLNKNCRIVDLIQGKIFTITSLGDGFLRGATCEKYKYCNEYNEEVREKYVSVGHKVSMVTNAQKAKNNYLFMRLVRNIWRKPLMY